MVEFDTLVEKILDRLGF